MFETKEGYVGPTFPTNGSDMRIDLKRRRNVAYLKRCSETTDEQRLEKAKGLPRTIVDILKADAKEISHSVLSTPSFIIESFNYYKDNLGVLRLEILTGIALSIILVPEAIAFAYMAGMPPITGLYSSFILTFITGVLGGRPPMVSGAAGALAVVVKEITSASGPLGHLSLKEREEHLLLAMVFCGLFQCVAAILKLGSLAKVLPQSAIIGFCNGLAIVIFRSQLTTFKTCDTPGILFDECNDNTRWLTFPELQTWLVIIQVLVSVAIMQAWPKLPRVGKIIPASLISLLVGSFIEHCLIRLPTNSSRMTRTIGETAPIAGDLPTWHVPNVPSNTESYGVVLQYGAFAAAVGLIESILTLQVISEAMELKVTDNQLNRECFAQGFGNVISGLFQAIGGGALLGESVLSLNAGARNRLSTSVCGWCVLLIFIAANKAINYVPMATLTGVIFGVVIHTFYWPCLIMLHRIRKSDTIVIIVVTLLAVFTNLAIAVGVGVLIAALVSMWDASKLLHVHRLRRSKDLLAASSSAPISPNTTPPPDLDNVVIETLSPVCPDEAVRTNDAPDTRSSVGSPAPLLSKIEGNAGNRTSSPSPIPSRDGAGIELVASDGSSSLSSSSSSSSPLPSLPLPSDSNIIYYIEGVLFFASCRQLTSFFTPSEDPPIVTVDLTFSTVADYSSVFALIGLARRYVTVKKTLVLTNLDSKSQGQCERITDFLKLFTKQDNGSYICSASPSSTAESADITQGNCQAAVPKPVGNHGRSSLLSLEDNIGIGETDVATKVPSRVPEEDHSAEELGIDSLELQDMGVTPSLRVVDKPNPIS